MFSNPHPALAILGGFLVVVAGGCAEGNRQDPGPRAVTLALALEPLQLEAGPVSGEPFLWGEPGRVLISWLDRDGDSTALRFAGLGQTSSEWTEPRTIAEGDNWFVNWADVPSVAASGDRMWAHWLEYNGDGKYSYGVRVSASSDDGASWTVPVWLHEDRSPTEHGFGAIALAGDAFHAAWLDGRKADQGPAEMTVRSRELGAVGPAGDFGSEVLLDDRSCDCCPNAMASLDAGGLILAYRDRSPGEIRDIYYTRLVDGVWETPRPVHEDGWQINACPVNGPAVAAWGEHVAMAWFTAEGDRPRVNLAFSADSGASFGDPITLDERAPIGRVDVVLLDDGSAVASWIGAGETPDRADIVARRVLPDGRMSDVVTLVETTGARASGYPRMERSGPDLIFAWTETEPSRSVRTARARIEG